MLDKMLKMRNKKGFTLMEMLIVVAIIAILIAIAIPTFNSSLNKAKDGTDLANARSLFSAAKTAYMTDGKVPTALQLSGSQASVTYDGTTYAFNSAPTMTYTAAAAGEAGTWSIVTVPKNADATPAQTFSFTLDALPAAG